MIIVCRFWRVVKPHVMRLPIIPGTPRCLVTNQSYLVYISVFACQAHGLSPTAGPRAGDREDAWCLGTSVAWGVKRWEVEGLTGVLESSGTSFGPTRCSVMFIVTFAGIASSEEAPCLAVVFPRALLSPIRHLPFPLHTQHHMPGSWKHVTLVYWEIFKLHCWLLILFPEVFHPKNWDR